MMSASKSWDNGLGMSEEMVEKLLTDNNHVPKHGSGVGVINVHNRIRIRFGEGYGWKLRVSLMKERLSEFDFRIFRIQQTFRNIWMEEDWNVREVQQMKRTKKILLYVLMGFLLVIFSLLLLLTGERQEVKRKPYL